MRVSGGSFPRKSDPAAPCVVEFGNESGYASFNPLQPLVRLKFKAKPGPPSLGTALHRLSVLSWAHQQMHLANPVASVEIRALLAAARKAAAKSGQRLVTKKPAITRDVLHQLLATCDDSLHGVRDRALLLFAFASGGRRRSEVCGALVSRLERRGEAGFAYTLGATKTNQAGNDDPSCAKPVAGLAAAALSRWLELSGVVSGHLFRSIDRFDHIGGKLSDQSVTKIVKKRAELAGLPDHFSAHSLRSGFVTEAGRRGIPVPEGMAFTGHRSVAAFVGYHRAGASLESPASRLAEDAP
jgi:integrase